MLTYEENLRAVLETTTGGVVKDEVINIAVHNIMKLNADNNFTSVTKKPSELEEVVMTDEEAAGRLNYVLSTCDNKKTSYAKAISAGIEALENNAKMKDMNFRLIEENKKLKEAIENIKESIEKM